MSERKAVNPGESQVIEFSPKTHTIEIEPANDTLTIIRVEPIDRKAKGDNDDTFSEE